MVADQYMEVKEVVVGENYYCYCFFVLAHFYLSTYLNVFGSQSSFLVGLANFLLGHYH